MNETPLFHVWTYNDVDRAFWARHLEDWVPTKIIDAHMHITDLALRLEPMTDEKRYQYWVTEVNDPTDAPTVDRCYGITFPDRDVSVLTFAFPDYDYDIDGANAYLQRECPPRGWHSLAVICPHWSAEKVEQQLAAPGVVGAKA